MALIADASRATIMLVVLTLISDNFVLRISSSSRYNSPLVERDGMKPETTVTPVVLWHGLNSTSEDVLPWAKFIQKRIPGVYVLSLRIGNSTKEDLENSFFMEANEQVRIACDIISKDGRLRDGYNAIGLSQGGLFMRGVAERCPVPRMRSLITLGSPHQGFYGIPRCPYQSTIICSVFTFLLNKVAYTDWLQRHVTQAGFWHDPFEHEKYANRSKYLADINNERPVKNQSYKENLQRLENFVIVKFAEEEVLRPAITVWFGFFTPGQDIEIQDFKETALYREDWIGLRTLHSTGRLHFLESPGQHMYVDWKWIEKNIVYKFLMPDKPMYS